MELNNKDGLFVRVLHVAESPSNFALCALVAEMSPHPDRQFLAITRLNSIAGFPRV